MPPNFLNRLGFALLALCFAGALTRVIAVQVTGRGGAASADGSATATIRFSHWQLENGPREALDKIAAEYMRRNPHVRVVQIPIPERIYTNWLITQLVGGTAPDLIQIGKGSTDERLVRFFTPLSDLVNAPNPHNAGTDLADVPLRDTLIDGMLGGYSPALLDYFQVPISGYCVRVYYNLDALKTLTGSEKLPATYAEFIALCDLVERAAARPDAPRDGPRTALAGSKDNGPLLMHNLFSSQTRGLTEELTPVGNMEKNPDRLAGDYLMGRWSLDHPAYRSGLQRMREVGRHMPSGFTQMLRDDAALAFVQGRTLMITTGSWDATSLREQAAFRIGVGPIPLPAPPAADGSRGDSFERVAQVSEAGNRAGLGFGLTRGSRNPEIARDFLRFLVSREMNQKWTDESQWIPAVVGVRAGPLVAPFLPIIEGGLVGFPPDVDDSFSDLKRLCETRRHLLFGPDGSPERFVQAVQPGYADAAASDLRRRSRAMRDTARRGDSQFAAVAWLARQPSADATAVERFDTLLQASSGNDRNTLRTRLFLERANRPLD